MKTIALMLLYVIVALIVFNIVLYSIIYIIENRNEVLTKIKKCYEYFRQRICKKSNKVNDDPGAVHYGSEFYDSSSVWED